ncbi:efflux RND transporter permease subunit [Porphyromonas pogonae]|uniref:efflux RND transporter permease subunit n=1 Tax=Porphyromonas pogonae TaxID=867595 RepID=UPI002E775D8B|nr:efflux RND transporter permease subunit [Porphyromonas pogonae]
MSIYEIAVKKPVTTSLIFIGIFVLGLFSLTRLSTSLMPDIETNNIMVLTSYNGASAEDIETNITKPLENVLNGISNLKHITSKSQDNISVITLQFEAGTDIAEATNDVRDKLDFISNLLPDEVGRPMIFKFGSNDIPVTVLSAEAKQSTGSLKKILENQLTNRLARIDGVGTVLVVGTVNREIQIYCDPYKLQAYNIPIAQIAQIVGAENRNISTGLIDVGSQTNSLRVQGELRDPKELESLVIANYQGHNVYLRDVARVVDTEAERQQEIYANNNRGAIIVVRKQADANAVKISQAIAKALPEIRSGLPSDVKVKYVVDTSTFIVKTIDSLKSTIFITFLVVMLVVLFFLGRWRATIIIVITIPISLIGAFIYLMATGNTLNIISLSSLSIAIGMVVDDAIVVLENITKHIERGSYPKQAAVHATNEVGISVIASTLTMLAVFLPLTMVQGFTGILFRQLGWIVSIVMIVSTIAALSLTPMLCSLLLKRNPKQSRLQKKIFTPIDKFLDKVDTYYGRFLHWGVHHRTLVILGTLGLFILTLMMSPLLKTEFMPEADNSYLTATVELPVGTNMPIAKEVGQRIYDRWIKEVKEIDVCTMTAGQADEDNSMSAINENGNNILSFYINLLPRSERERGIGEISAQLRKIVDDFPEVSSYTIGSGQGGGATGQANVKIDIFGHDFLETDKVAKKLLDDLHKSKACAEANISRKDYKPEYRIEFDRQKLADNGLNISSAASFVKAGLTGNIASYYREDGEEYKIRVHLDPKFRESMTDISNIMIYTPQGKGIRLGDLANIVERDTPPTIDRKDRSRVVTVTASVAKGAALSDLVKDTNKSMKSMQIPSGITYTIGGTYEDQQKSFADLGTLMLLIILLVFIVMAAQFESLVDPFVIMFAIPFAISGVIIGLLLSGKPFGAMALIGLIMLMGIVVKNGIVLIDYTRLCRERGMGILQAVTTAGKSRLRPVLMTTLTTILGMVPLAIGIGEGSELWQPMGITVAWGLAFSTLITLIIVPTVYASISGIGVKRERKRLEKKLKVKHHKA